MNALLTAHQMQISAISSSEVHGHCARLPGTKNVVVDLTQTFESLVVAAEGGVRVGETIPCVPLSRDRERNVWRGSLALGKTMRFFGDHYRVPGSSRAIVHGIHQGRVVVRVDGAVLGVVDANLSACIQSIPAGSLGDFIVGCPGYDPQSGLVQAVVPLRPFDEPIQLARVLAVWEYSAAKNTKREVRVFVKTVSGMLGVASASECMKWMLATGQHVTVEFKPNPLLYPPSETNCVLVGADFSEAKPPPDGSVVNAIVVKVQSYGAFCLVANSVIALMHRNDCFLDQSQDVTKHFGPGDRVRGSVHSHDQSRGTYRLRLMQIVERRTLRSWSDLSATE